ncbi:nitrile hydratase subunit beta [Paenibacillus abyssi]|uniref:Nitrile hydratase subunit beta n=1 Tax=Paenibacillus abyssi TaxID=1340531 RepID=A0A917FPU9_9BACL|nr:nitrile hydratase subunit beta [Paenibacillus abyssi]GGF93434.1 nitrile hydratase subunit beta [Paenibacillus abyssi]
MNGIHDVGGMDGFGPVKREENEPVFHERWEGRVRALSMLINKKRRLYFIDESRHTIERIHPVYYMGSSYYQLWLLRFETMMMERGVLTEQEIQERMGQIAPGASFEPDLAAFRTIRPHNPTQHRRTAIQTTSGTASPNEPVPPKYKPGTVVQAKLAATLGHTRIPRYIRGKQGVIEAVHGHSPIPDIRVDQGLSLYQPVYRVRFKARELWGEDASPKDTLCIELWEDYLEQA